MNGVWNVPLSFHTIKKKEFKNRDKAIVSSKLVSYVIKRSAPSCIAQQRCYILGETLYN